MECKLVHETVNVNEIVFEGSNEQSIDIDIVLPDYCPDIGKILKCQVVPRILTKDYSNERLTVDGCALIRVFYVDDVQKCMRSFEQDFPFTTEFNVKSAAQSVCACVKTKTDYVNCRAVSQRKLDIHAAVTISASVSANQSQEFISNVCGAGVNLRTQTIHSSSLVTAAEEQFSISEMLELGSTKPPVGTIVRSEAVIYTSEQKAIANKLILKGEAVIRMLYRNDLEEDKLDTMEFNIPISQIIDAAGIDDSCECDVVVDVVSLKLSPRADSDGEYKMINMDLRACCTVKAFIDQEVSLISDAYSTQYELEMQERNIRLEKMVKNVTDNYILKDTQTIKGENVAGVSDLWCDISEITSNVKSGKLTIKGAAVFSILAFNENQEHIFLEKTSNFEYECSVYDGDASARAEAKAIVSSVGYSFAGDEKIELRAEIKLTSPVYAVNDVRSISSIEPDESRCKNLDKMPPVVVYYASKGECLWDIARKFNSSVEVIMQENEISDEVLSEKAMLLISI